MIEICLAEQYTTLSDAELLRLQKTLKIILSRGLDPDRLRRMVREAYARLGKPLDLMERLDISESFFQLLDGFGWRSIDQMTARELADLQKCPYTIWPDERHCVVSGEALELLAPESALRKRNYLYGELTRLPVKERRAWFRWLGLDHAVRSEKDRCNQIYVHLAQRRRQLDLAGETTSPELPEFLDQIFPDDPMHTPVAWFYRDILPLYQTLRDTEEQLAQSKRSGARQRAMLDAIGLIKSGRVIVRATRPDFGESTRYRLVWTRESTPAQIQPQSLPQSVRGSAAQATEQRQEVLF